MTDLDPDPGFKSKTAYIQLSFGIWVNMTTMVIGLAYGLPTVQILQLSSPASDILLTNDEKLWINSMAILFSPIGCIITGIVLDNLGRRIPILVCNFMLCVTSMYMASISSIRHIIIARALTGVGCGMAMEVPRLYTSEISLANMRGLLGAMPNIFLSFGVLLEVALGFVVPWKQLCYISCLLSLVLFFSYFFLPESPEYLLLDDVHQAIQALHCFRAHGYHTEKEHNRLIEFKQNNNIRRLSFLEKLAMVVSSSTLRPSGIVITYLSLALISGIPIVKYWSSDVLAFSNSSLDTGVDILLVAIVAQIFSIIPCVLMYRFRRVRIAIISAIGVGLSSIILGSFLVYNNNDSVIPPIVIMVYTCFATLGFQYLPFLLLTEIYPLEIRGMMIGLSLTLYTVMASIGAYYLQTFYIAFKISNIWFMWGFAALLAALFLYLLMPETSDLTLQEVEEYFRGTRPALVSDRKVLAIEAELKRKRINTKEIELDPDVAAIIALRESLNNVSKETKSYVEASDSVNSVRSLGRKRSVTLIIGDKHYMTDKAVHEIEEQLKELDQIAETSASSDHPKEQQAEAPTDSHEAGIDKNKTKESHSKTDLNEVNDPKPPHSDDDKARSTSKKKLVPDKEHETKK